MNFKRNLFIISALVGTVFAVAGCEDKNAFVKFDYENTISDIKEQNDNHEDLSFADGNYVKPGNYNDYTAIGYNGVDKNLGSAYSVMTNQAGKAIFPSVGEQKVLVIPVEFEDFQIEKHLGVTLNSYLNDINKAFFGVSRNNAYVSLSEYYYRSSYGQLKISGKVCDQVYTFPESVSSITSRVPSVYEDKSIVSNCYDNILNWYQSKYDDINDYKIDPNKDLTNNVPIYLIYDLPSDYFGDEYKTIFWSYTFVSKPLSWISYSSFNSLNDEPDAHTVIHETGHLLGLVDYYPEQSSTNKDTSPIEPSGRIDMMDCSVGDHTALSKMLLNWARPYQVKGDCEITISSLVDYGDLILINDIWNGTVFDEYYLLEFYSPTGLNYYDIRNGNNLIKLPSMPGVKLYRVDARLGYYVQEDIANLRKNFKLADYCDAAGGCSGVKKVDFARDNTNYTKTTTKGIDTNNYLYELYLNHVGHAISGAAVNEHLYRTGDVIEGLRLENSRPANYRITITGMTYRDATIKFEKI